MAPCSNIPLEDASGVIIQTKMATSSKRNSTNCKGLANKVLRDCDETYFREHIRNRCDFLHHCHVRVTSPTAVKTGATEELSQALVILVNKLCSTSNPPEVLIIIS